jgi:hypothetical protein
MATQAQISANRRNGLRSRGPRTNEGKNRSRWNALKHGLATDILADRPRERKVAGYEQLFLKLSDQEPAARLYARAAAEAQQIIDEVRDLRIKLINDAYEAPATFSRPMHWLDRVRFNMKRMPHEEVAQRALGGWEHERYSIVDRPFDEAQGFAVCLRKLVAKLRCLRRYEQIAFSKRRQALRALLNF